MDKLCASQLELLANIPETSRLLTLLVMGYGCRVEYKYQHWDSYFLITVNPEVKRRVEVYPVITAPSDKPVTYTDIDKHIAKELGQGIQTMLAEGLING